MSPKTARTRQKIGDVGTPSVLPDAGALYTKKDIIAAINNELTKSPKISVHEAIVNMRDSVMQKFLDINPALHLLSLQNVNREMKRLHEESVKFKNNKLTAKHGTSFKDRLSRLFDIITCKCDIVNCGGGTSCRDEENCTGFHVCCSCPLSERIPETEVSFVKDQRDKVGLLGSEMRMKRIDNKEIKPQKEKAERETKIREHFVGRLVW